MKITKKMRSRQGPKRKRLESSSKTALYIKFWAVVFLWFVFGHFIYFTQPTDVAILVFFVFLYINVFLTANFVTSSQGRLFAYPLGVVFFLALRLVGVGNVLNLLFLLGAATAFEVYSRSRDIVV